MLTGIVAGADTRRTYPFKIRSHVFDARVEGAESSVEGGAVHAAPFKVRSSVTLAKASEAERRDEKSDGFEKVKW